MGMMEDDSFENASKSFMSWLSAQQGVMISSKVSLHDYRGQNAGRGLIATENIADDEVLFSIPRHTLLSWQNSSLSSKLAADESSDLGDWNFLILTMLYESSQQENSTWQQYLNILPQDFSTPMFWSDLEINELQGSTLASKIGREEADQSYYNLIHPVLIRHPDLFDPSRCTLQDFHRMGSIIMAYSFDAPLNPISDDNESLSAEEEEEEFEKVMCPLADLLNADTALNNARLYYEPNALLMKSISPINASDQIYNTYGDLPNSDLLRRYGYVQINNQNNVVEVPGDLITSLFTMSNSEKLSRVDWLLDNEVLDDSFEISYSGKIPQEMLATIALMSMTTSDFKQITEAGEVPKASKTETLRAQVIHVLQLRLNQYSTSILEDEALLAMSGISRKLADAIHVRLPEKEILERAIEGAKSWELVAKVAKARQTGKREGPSDHRNDSKRKKLG